MSKNKGLKADKTEIRNTECLTCKVEVEIVSLEDIVQKERPQFVYHRHICHTPRA